jgi:hypothetical protein
VLTNARTRASVVGEQRGARRARVREPRGGEVDAARGRDARVDPNVARDVHALERDAHPRRSREERLLLGHGRRRAARVREHERAAVLTFGNKRRLAYQTGANNLNQGAS